MNVDFELFFRALGLAFFLEGLLWAICPEGMRQLMTRLVTSAQQDLRMTGIIAMMFGLLLIWFVSR
ncbi:MAG: DUF2065 domain-containing protein [Desulfovibrio sp.]|nr:DUF2065 domain-containing protein [Desulfovibrio sp.]